jgi:hypothetical protein
MRQPSTPTLALIAAMGLVAMAAAPVSAQWLKYPTAGIPRTPDGKPNLSAPAPRTRDGKPDLSGIWQLEPAPCDPTSIQGCGADYSAALEFRNIGARLKGGLPYQPWAATVVEARTADLGKDDPVGRCQPAGALRLFTYPPYRKIIQIPGVTVILSERDVTYRQIFTDRRPLPKDPSPSWNGYSSGRWEGDSLVVDTIGFRDGIWLDRNGSPMTDAARMTEKFRRANFGNLEIEVTIDDPKAYTKPWTIKLHQVIVPDTELLDYFCQENEKDTAHLVGK